ncbi:hypothetical protein HRW14_08805 [Streptomyces lunaelactis]|uniref:hypothetical protein n=1 Tax=Streptomyces lunaelactis TaxID=1535768 RepID=UPI0015846795|nr:hypothetical protein [Streptomyces lunaelactis]NUK50388.1 hypothetical protein [Streptomyces lunaelactis]
MRIIIEDPDQRFQDKLLALIAEHRDSLTLLTDTEWTPERAATLLRNLPSKAARVIVAAVDGGGYVAAEDLREEGGSMRGHTGPITHALNRGVREGWWPEGMPTPIKASYNADVAGAQRAAGFQLGEGLLPVFQAAVTQVEDMGFGSTQLSKLTKAVAEQGGDWDPSRSVAVLAGAGFTVTAKRARELLRRIADTGLLVKTDAHQAMYRAAESPEGN